MRFNIRFAGVVAMLCASLATHPGSAQTAQPDGVSQQKAQKGLATKAVEAAKGAASAAGDILTRVPCLPAKGLKDISGSLPRVARRIAADEPVTIVAFGSSTTVGFGT
ncbi:MAG TPA: SGNH/GDSL hydrolase family protein, partial [Afipia sp.]